ncbi:heterokaryon incompatibility protein-domain-containing protein [Xylaria grammica]|nr:heterokaryon incompatibility protein-domain-containing protein [Xylaria grammica]
MRLVNALTYQIHEFLDHSVEDYAILSHTWDEEECTLRDMSGPDVELQKGYTKINFCCEQTITDGLNWVWVDTCCIDKTSTAELSEAINSMFRWYSNAKVCYAYLADVIDKDELASSRWFTRGWTLQELIAPKAIRKFSEKITGIDAFVLSTGSFHQVCVAKRMSWAAKCSTTRIEDQAYSLMGIFDVNMPLIYGEGTKAFLRLQQEILRVSDDQSLFAWGAPEVFLDMHNFIMSRKPNTHGLFADSPANFLSSHEILTTSSQEDSPPPVIHGNGIRIQYPICVRGRHEFIILACTTRSTARAYIGIPVEKWGGSFYARCGPLVLIFPEHWTKARAKLLVVKEPPIGLVPSVPAAFQIVRVPNKMRTRKQDPILLDEVFCLPHARYHPVEHSIILSTKNRGPHTALFFAFSTAFDVKRRSMDGLFPIRCFAIILGSSKYPWTIFIPILRDAHEDADFHRILRESTAMAKCCMTKSQLKEKLSQGDMTALVYKTRPRLDQLLSVWRIAPSICRNLELSVDLDVAQINLVDGADAVRSEEATAERGNYRPDWLTID